MSRDDIDKFGEEEKTPEQILAEKISKRERQRDVDDMAKILKIVEGRRVIYKMLKEAKVFGALMTPNSNMTSFNLGMREMGISLLDVIMEADPNAYFQMHREYVSELKSKSKPKDKEQ